MLKTKVLLAIVMLILVCPPNSWKIICVAFVNLAVYYILFYVLKWTLIFNGNSYRSNLYFWKLWDKSKKTKTKSKKNKLVLEIYKKNVIKTWEN